MFRPFTGHDVVVSIVIAVLLVCSALVSGSETAFFSLTPRNIAQLKTGRSRSGRAILKLLSVQEYLLATILIVNNLVNMGKDVKGFWTFNLPVKNADYNKLQKNKRFKVEIIDVWAMTVTEYPVIFETTEELDYRVFDIHHRGVRIPDAPYIVLRITEVK